MKSCVAYHSAQHEARSAWNIANFCLYSFEWFLYRYVLKYKTFPQSRVEALSSLLFESPKKLNHLLVPPASHLFASWSYFWRTSCMLVCVQWCVKASHFFNCYQKLHMFTNMHTFLILWLVGSSMWYQDALWGTGLVPAAETQLWLLPTLGSSLTGLVSSSVNWEN